MHKLLPHHALRLVKLLAVLTALVGAGVFIFYDSLLLRLALLWNIFLAGMPLLFALLFLYVQRRQKPILLQLACGLLWLVFFPNAPYMITDFVHACRYQYVHYIGGHIEFLPRPTSWFGLLHLWLGIAVGVLLGMLSLYLLHCAVAKRFGACAGWLFCGTTSALSGFAIYLGRFMRFNTWDLFTHPHHIVLQVWESLSAETLQLYTIFAAMTILPYLLFYACFHTE